MCVLSLSSDITEFGFTSRAKRFSVFSLLTMCPVRLYMYHIAQVPHAARTLLRGEVRFKMNDAAMYSVTIELVAKRQPGGQSTSLLRNHLLVEIERLQRGINPRTQAKLSTALGHLKDAVSGERGEAATQHFQLAQQSAIEAFVAASSFEDSLLATRLRIVTTMHLMHFFGPELRDMMLIRQECLVAANALPCAATARRVLETEHSTSTGFLARVSNILSGRAAYRLYVQTEIETLFVSLGRHLGRPLPLELPSKASVHGICPIGEPLRGHTSCVNVMIVDGRRLFSGSSDGTIRVWDVETLQPMSEPLRCCHRGRVTALAVGGGRLVAGSSEPGAIVVWNLETLQPVGEIRDVFHRQIRALAVERWRIFASGKRGSASSPVYMWDLETLQPVDRPLDGGLFQTTRAMVAAEGRLLAAATNVISAWDLEGLGLVCKGVLASSGKIRALTLIGKRLFIGGDCTMIRAWDLDDVWRAKDKLPFRGEGVAVIQHGRERVNSLAVAGRWLFAAQGGRQTWSKVGEIRVWDLETLQQVGDPLQGHTEHVTCLAVVDGKLFSGSMDHTIRVWSI